MPTADTVDEDVRALTGSDIMGQLSPIVRKFAKLGLIALVFTICLFQLREIPGSASILVIGLGTLIPCYFWVKRKNTGIPIVLLLALQCFFIYATPLLVNSKDIWNYYSEEQVLRSALEVFIYLVSLTIGWSFAISRTRKIPSRYYGFSFLKHQAQGRLLRICLTFLFVSLIYQIALNEGWMNKILQILPSATSSIIRTLVDAAAFVGGMLGGFFIGRRQMPPALRVTFWLLIFSIILLTISGFLLSSMTGLVISVLFGIFLGRGKFPLLAFTTFAAVFAFFNISKFEMRNKYWEVDKSYTTFSLTDLPAVYSEWIQSSFGMLLPSSGRSNSVGSSDDSGQSLLNRINNLQNLLFAQEAANERSHDLLRGQTYILIPKLLIPRIFWPEKPRAHEGQVLLNVHFGRQTEAASYQTYIAWGLLPEAFGNFGNFWGAVVIGSILGLLSGRLEGWSRFYPLLSLQMLLILALTLKLGVSFEMVASVFVTSTLQMIFVILIGAIPFLQKTRAPELIAKLEEPRSEAGL